MEQVTMLQITIIIQAFVSLVLSERIRTANQRIKALEDKSDGSVTGGWNRANIEAKFGRRDGPGAA